jgi:predicted metal-dependent hydrolase
MLRIFNQKYENVVYIGPNNIPVSVYKNSKLKRISITVKTDSSVRVTSPNIIRDSYIKSFLESKLGWIENKVQFFSNKHPVLSIKHTKKEYLKYSKDAMILVKTKLDYFNQYYNLDYKNISIRSQRTRWGSCSSRKNLSFNYKIIFLPNELQDYLIVHELCHLKEMNHSKNFWNLVGERIDNYKKLSKSLRIGDFK